MRRVLPPLPRPWSARQRGFALMIVVICGVAMVAIAIALAFTAGANRIVSVRGASIDRSETIAAAGMERAVAYAERVIEVERDFDLLLGPASVTNCGVATPPFANGNAGLPRFSDGASVTFRGRNYLRVPFNDGAYLVRFDDDDDDLISSLNLLQYTSNHNTSGLCAEGSSHNPYRDRNRTAWITVIGIYPGTDPATAPHQATLRRLHVSTANVTGPALYSADEIDLDGSLNFCSDIGNIASVGAVRGAGDACGPVEHDGSGSLALATNTGCGGVCSGPVQTSPAVPAFDYFALGAIPPIGSARWFNSGERRHCNFAVTRAVGSGTGTDAGALFFYTRAALPQCALNGSPPATTTIPVPVSTQAWSVGQVPGNPMQCWERILQTDTGPAAFNITGPGGGIPDWSQCGTRWKDGSTVGAAASGLVASVVSGAVVFAPGVTIPATVHFGGSSNEDLGDLLASGGATPSDDANAAQWTALTFVVHGDVSADEARFIGYGLDHAPFASLVVGGDLLVNGGGSNNPGFAGSVVGFDEFSIDNGAYSSSGFDYFGMVLFRGEIRVQSGAKLNMHYDNDLFGGVVDLPVVATTSRTLR